MNGVRLGVYQDQNFFKLDYRFLMKVARHVQNTRKKKFVKFLPYIKKKYCNCFCVLLWYKTLRYFTGFQSCLLLLVLGVGVVKNGRGILDHGTLTSESQENELIKWADFFACWYKFRKAIVNLIIIGWAWSKMDKNFRSYGL